MRFEVRTYEEVKVQQAVQDFDLVVLLPRGGNDGSDCGGTGEWTTSATLLQTVYSSSVANTSKNPTFTANNTAVQVWERPALIGKRNKAILMTVEASWDIQTLSSLPFFKKQLYDTLTAQLDFDDTVSVLVLHNQDSEEEDRVTALVLAVLAVLSHPMLRFDSSAWTNDLSIVAEDRSDSVVIRSTVSSNASMPAGTVLTGAYLEAQVMLGLQIVLQSCPSLQVLTQPAHQGTLLFMRKLLFSVLKDRSKPRGIQNMRHQLLHQLAQDTTIAESDEGMVSKRARLEGKPSISSSCPSSSASSRAPKALPSFDEGLKVFEFFSGIGGMRLSLSEEVLGIPVRHVVAFDISTKPNQVYLHNFHASSSSSRARLEVPKYATDNQLRNMLVEGLKVEDVDNQADIWTMSPPCQPYTTTRHANRLDHLDNRSKGLYHLMSLLLHCQHLPRFILVENVRGFVGSMMHSLWVQVMTTCGYRFEEYVLSPEDTVGLPNARKRFYFLASLHGSGGEAGGDSVSGTAGTEDDQAFQQLLQQSQHRAEPVSMPTELVEEEEDEQEEEAGDELTAQLYALRTALPNPGNSITRLSVGQVLHDLHQQIDPVTGNTWLSVWNHTDALLVPQRILSSSWAKPHLSIVQLHHQLTYCFTKGYGKIYDHSAGSCYYMDHSDLTGVDRERLPDYHGKIRLFHPRELLLLFGFPTDFSFPEGMSLQQQFSCIGNSVSVAVIRVVMQRLFSLAKE